ncbi:MAG: SCO family protein [Bacteroidia bacterium]|nr:SCO family protein [Bacteroidia bacterium]
MSSDKFKKGGFIAALFVVPTVLCFAFYYFVVRKPLVEGSASKMYIKLPIYGERQVKSLENGTVDTIYHTLPDFTLINQDSIAFGTKNFENKIFVADFFFTSCKTICPKMATNLILAQKKLDYIKKDFSILSVTVDPSTDTPHKLKEYAKKVHAEPDIWNFVTGDKKEIYSLALNGFLVNALEDTSKAIPDFLHSEKIVLIDRERRIRGFYDGTSTAEINRLIDEIKVLQTAYPHNK